MLPFVSSRPTLRATPRRPIRCMVGWTCCFTLFLAVPATTYAQTEDRIWAGLGLGLGAILEEEEDNDGPEALTGVLYASYQTGANVFSLRAAAAGELFGDTFSDVGLLYGRARPSQSGHASLSIGLALVIGERRCDGIFSVCSSGNGVEPVGETERVVTLGLPIEAQLFWRPLAFGAIGLYGFANVNPEASFVGATVGLQLGDF